ncbi:MAG: hypothetical protein WAV82_12265 [Methylobacter sp.]
MVSILTALLIDPVTGYSATSLLQLVDTDSPAFTHSCPADGTASRQPAQDQLVDFMMALTDECVCWEKTPFDHPELYIPNGARGVAQKVKTCGVPGVWPATIRW